MKIAAIHVHPLALPFRSCFPIAPMGRAHVPNLLVRILTEEGLEGQGEAAPFPGVTGETEGICLAAARELAGLVRGRDPRSWAALSREMAAFLPRNATTRSAFDMALLDLAAQAAGLPLWRFLGGERRPIPTDITLDAAEHAAAAEAARRYTAMGFRAIKVKLDGEPEEDERRLRAVAEAAGPGVALRLDACQAWDAAQAVRELGRLADLRLEFCEQPVRADALAGLRWVRERSPVPVMADEALTDAPSALALARMGAADAFNIKLSKAGGLAEAARVAAVASAAGIPCMIGSRLESRLGITAAAHFALSQDSIRFADLDGHMHHTLDPVQGGILIQDGEIHLPAEGAGLGARFPADYLADLPCSFTC